MCLSVCVYIYSVTIQYIDIIIYIYLFIHLFIYLYYVTIQYIDIIIIHMYIYILHYRDHMTILRAVEAPFSPIGDRLVSQNMGIRANSRLLRTLPSKLPCTTVTKPWHVEKQCHEPPIWEWVIPVIPPIKMVKFHQPLGMVYFKVKFHNL